ncbi:WXG100 family type VII secretion target [Cohnella fermenti]|uniref:ESAT-6-like protein n=1 Tax=Cohnella fermenti TaxID=2565925 RepID=A0A4S4BHA2_9BACL|nr:WXG100 family type VII secretion target [Cohnella fermenti]THF73923.1 WXG100 family type VII secretion target [Cohnella fermenti]
MARKIVVDPAKLESAAQQIDAQAADYEQQFKQLFMEVDGMGAAWKGVDNVAYTTQIKGFEDDFRKMKELMIQYSDFLKTSATTYRNTQSDLVSQAKKLVN